MKKLHVSLLPLFLCLIAALLLLNLNGTPKDKPDEEKKELPYSFTHKVKKLRKVPTYKMKLTDAEITAYAEKLKKRPGKRELDEIEGKSMRIDGNPETSGLWENIPNVGRIWRLKICAPGAKGVGFDFDKFEIPEGGQFFFYNKDKTQMVGPISKPNAGSAYRPTLSISGVPGEEVIVEYNQPASSKGKADFNIRNIKYRFADFPKSFFLPSKRKVPVVTNPFTPESEARMLEALHKIDRNKHSISFNPIVIEQLGEMGIMDSLSNGDKIWRVCIKVDFAQSFSISVQGPLPKGAYIHAYAPDKSVVSRIFKKHNKYNNDKITIVGPQNNEVIVEYFEPANIHGIGHPNIKGLDIYPAFPTKGTSGFKAPIEDCNSQVCSPNVICFDDDYTGNPFLGTPYSATSLDLSSINDLKRSVVHLKTFYPCDPPCTGNENFPNVPEVGSNCTGTLVSNKSGKPYILTAHHCLDAPSTLTNALSYNIGDELYWRASFKHENSDCNGILNIDAYERTINGAVAVAGSDDLDFLLIELNEPVPAEFAPYYAGIDALTQTLSTKGLGIHHPGGLDKKVAIQDDDLNLTSNISYDGVKPYQFFLFGNSGDYMGDITEYDDGDHFALTYDRGVTRPGSSGSAFFNPTGKVIGQLRTGASCCDDAAPNGNSNKVSRYGRLWFSWDKILHPTMPVSEPPTKITDSAGNILPGTTDEQKQQTLIYWLDPNNETGGMMEGVDVTDCDIYMRDGYCDDGSEPNFNCDMGGWDDIWSSPDLWSTSSYGSYGNEEINPLSFDNYMGYRIHNNNDACTSAPALLHLYWTMASTGEMWTEHWVDHIWWDHDARIIICPYGDEMFNSPVQIPALNPGETYEGWMDWFPPYYTIYPEPNSYDPEFCEINPDVENGQFEICLLARIMSLDNPIRNEAEGPIAENVLASNNIVTRNTFLIDPLPGEPPKPHCILISNNNASPHNLNVTFEQVAKELDLDYNANTVIEILPSITLWDAWQSTDAKSEGLQVTGNRVVEVTNFTSAKLLDIPFDPKEQKPLCIKVYDTSGGSSSGKAEADAVQFTFKIAHEPANPNDHINASSACIFKVSRKSAPIYPAQSLRLVGYPNPFTTQTRLVFSLPNEAAVHLNIYDLKGALVQTLATGHTLPEGEHTLLWQAETLPNGVYVATLKTPFAELSTKIVKTK